MIIFGTRGLTSTAGTGVFHCPRCGPQRPYALKKVNRWFTLYFIPVIPMGSAGEYVECSSCAGTFGTEAIHHNPEAEQQQVLDDLKRILILAAIARGPANDAKIANVQAAYAGLTEIHIMPEEIWQEIRMAQTANAQLIPYAQRVGGQFTDEAKKMILAGVGSVLSSNTKIDPMDESLLRQLATALGMSGENAEAVLQKLR